jgi:hypothetical protein
MAKMDEYIPKIGKEDILSLVHPLKHVNTIRKPEERMHIYGAILGAALVLGFLLPINYSPLYKFFRNELWFVILYGGWTWFGTSFSAGFVSILYTFFPLVAGVAVFLSAAKLKAPKRNAVYIAVGGLALVLTFFSYSRAMLLWGFPGLSASSTAGRMVVFMIIFYCAAGTFAFARLRHWYLDNSIFRITMFVLGSLTIVLYFIPIGGVSTKTNIIPLQAMFKTREFAAYLPLILVLAFAVISVINVWYQTAKENLTWFNVVAGRVLWMAIPLMAFIAMLASGTNFLHTFVGLVKSFLLTYGFLLVFMYGLVDALSTPVYRKFLEKELANEAEAAAAEKPKTTEEPAGVSDELNAKLKELKAELDAGKIDEKEYEKRRAQLIDKF